MSDYFFNVMSDSRWNVMSDYFFNVM